MFRHRLRAGFLSVGISALFVAMTVSSTGQETKKTAPKDKSPLDRDSFHLKVEPILDGNDDMAVYRIQIWTVAEPEFSDIGFGEPGRFRREKHGSLYRTDFVIVANIRPADELKRPDGKAQFELYFTSAGARGVNAIIDNVNASTRINQLLEIESSDRICKLGSKQVIGVFRKKKVEVTVK